MGHPGLFFVYFRPFLITISMIQIEKSIDGAFGIRTHGRRMVGADDTTDLCAAEAETNFVNKII